MWRLIDPYVGMYIDHSELSNLLSVFHDIGSSTRGAVLIIPGFGMPAIEKKQKWLENNIIKIRGSIPDTWYLFVFVSCYSQEAEPIFCGQLPKFPKTVWFVRFQADFLGQFIVREMKPDTLFSGLPHIGPVMILLDDVEIVGACRLMHMYHSLQWEDLHIISPSLDKKSASGHKFMFRLWPVCKQTFRRTNYAELFFYVMTEKGYHRWHSLMKPSTRFMWGVDMILFPNKMRIGIDETCSVRHHISSKLEKSPHYRGMQDELRAYARSCPQNIAFRFKNLWTFQKKDHDKWERCTNVVSINPRYQRIDRIPPDLISDDSVKDKAD